MLREKRNNRISSYMLRLLQRTLLYDSFANGRFSGLILSSFALNLMYHLQVLLWLAYEQLDTAKIVFKRQQGLKLSTVDEIMLW